MSPNTVKNEENGRRDPRLVAIVTPLHRFPLTPDEEISIRHLRQYLGGFDRYIIGPKKPPPEFADFRLKRFPRRFFRGVQSYSRLLVRKRFYQAFADYQYILIYQPDCLVFSSDLERWCRGGWDYVGAPWFKDFDLDTSDGFWAVGNGGLSLRKVSTALAVLTSKRTVDDPKERGLQTQRFSSAPQLRRLLVSLRTFLFQHGYRNNRRWLLSEYDRKHPYSEDLFWAFLARKLVADFTIPTPQQAVAFSFESAPRYCFQQNSMRLPFGCHAWTRFDRKFWEPYLLK